METGRLGKFTGRGMGLGWGRRREAGLWSIKLIKVDKTLFISVDVLRRKADATIYLQLEL